MGNEQRGLSDKLITECDQLIKIPMLGSSDSLNLAVSTGIALYESIRKNPI
jgi:tRNA G18 (ribose-2'-O)-methylase SpoU